MSLKQNINIRHACNGGEYKLHIKETYVCTGNRYMWTPVSDIKVDGYCEATNTIYQFQGCYFHGCPKCYNDLTKNKVSGLYMYKLYENTLKIDEAIRRAGYNLETIWEHEFDNDKEMKGISLDE